VPGTASWTSAGIGSGCTSPDSKRSAPYSTTEVEGLGALGGEGQDRRAVGSGERHRLTGGTLREARQGGARQARRLGPQRLERHGDAQPRDRLVGRPLEHLPLVAQQEAGLGDRAFGGRRQRAQHRQHLVAQPGAREARILVGRVIAPGEAARAAVLAGVLASGLQQRPDEAAAARRHAEQCARAGRDRKPVEDGLGLVAGRMRGGEVGPVLIREPLGDRVARLARLRLQVALAQLHALDGQRDAEAVADDAAELLVGVRSRPQAVIDVERSNLGADPHSAVQQADGVGTAGQQHQKRVPGPDQSARLRDLEGPFPHGLSLPGPPDRASAAR
jgi:hypothetical protein